MPRWITPELYEKVWKRDNGRCVYCGHEKPSNTVRPRPHLPFDEDATDKNHEVSCLDCFFDKNRKDGDGKKKPNNRAKTRRGKRKGR